VIHNTLSITMSPMIGQVSWTQGALFLAEACRADQGTQLTASSTGPLSLGRSPVSARPPSGLFVHHWLTFSLRSMWPLLERIAEANSCLASDGSTSHSTIVRSVPASLLAPPP
jgi:hypothetical protein